MARDRMTPNSLGCPKVMTCVPTVCCRMFTSNTKSISCPACKSKSIQIKGDLFCCSICPNRQEVNYFKLLSLPQSYTLDMKEAEEKYRLLQKSVHPDKLDSQLARNIPEGYSSLLNKAIAVIKSPIERAMHLLFLLDGCTISESDLTKDPTLLMEMMELNEEVDDCQNKECLEDLNKANELRLHACEAELATLFNAKDYKRVRVVCERMHYLERIKDTISRKLNST